MCDPSCKVIALLTHDMLFIFMKKSFGDEDKDEKHSE